MVAEISLKSTGQASFEPDQLRDDVSGYEANEEKDRRDDAKDGRDRQHQAPNEVRAQSGPSLGVV